MIPTYSNLLQSSYRKFSLKNWKKIPSGKEKAVTISATIGPDGLVLEPDTSGDGMFIYYVSQDATYGFADAGVNWACSGPYSGCKFQVGRSDLRIYASHIAREGGTDASDKLLQYLPEAAPAFDYTTGMGDVSTDTAMKLSATQVSKYLFAWWAGDFKTFSVTELTVYGNNLESGRIMKVRELKLN